MQGLGDLLVSAGNDCTQRTVACKNSFLIALKGQWLAKSFLIALKGQWLAKTVF